MADEKNDDLIVDDEVVTETPETPETPETSVQEGAIEAPKTPLDAISEAIDTANKPRRITSKAEELSQGDTRPRNADGTFKTETAEEKTVRELAEKIAKETPEEKTAREAEEANARVVDHVNDPIPKETNARTAERMKYLIDTVKSQTILGEQHEALFGKIRDTGASPDEFAQMVNYLGAVHSTDPKRLEAAYQMLQSELVGIAVKLGKPLFEVNLLRDPANKDLVDEIQGGTLTSNRAHEIALQRETNKRNIAANKTVNDTRATAETAAAASKAGTDTMNALGAELLAKDGAEIYNAKYDVLIPMLKPLFARLDPREWKGVFLDHYNNLTVQPKVAPVIKEKQQPLRTKQPAGSGGTAQAPKSALDAINAALDF